MRYSKLFGQTLREAPADSPSAGFALLARAAYMRFPSDLLSLGQLSFNRLSELIQHQLETLGAQEISPANDPFRLAESEIQSYRQLPKVLFCRNFPALHVFIMSASEESRNKLTDTLQVSFSDIMAQLKLTVLVSDNGSIFSTNAGDIQLLKCPSCGYLESAQLVKCAVVPPQVEQSLPVEKVLTPDCPTIEALAHYLNVTESKTAKALMLMARIGNKEEFLFVVVRGDTSLSLEKLKQATGAAEIHPASDEQIKASGAEPGYASPVGLINVRVVVDQLIPVSPNLVAGANEHGYHLLNTNYGRDYTASIVSDLVVSQVGDSCPTCNTPLEGLKLEQLTRFEKFPPTANSGSFTDENGHSGKVWHGLASIDLVRTLIATAEEHHDEKGLTLPNPIAPYDVYLVSLPGKTIDTKSIADGFYEKLKSSGITVLYDDRDERAGVKFNDADLIGCPIRITLGERNLQNGMVEYKLRTSQESQLIPLNEVISHIKPNG
jgi:prolyl-tRNA synthetase